MDAGYTCRRALWDRRPDLLPAFSSLLLGLLAACAGMPQTPPVSAEDTDWVLAGAGMLADPAVAKDAAAIEPPSSLLRVSQEMHRFAEKATHGHIDVAAKTLALAGAMDAQSGLNLQYDADATLSAEQAFQQRHVNCLSYTLLFVALARDVGLPVSFNDVDIPPVWDMGDDKTFLLYRHINAKVDLGWPLYQVVDVSAEEFNPTFYQSALSDAEAEAQYYNNRSVELRLQHKPIDALRYQLQALQLAPRTGYLWANLASLYQASGNLRAARIAISRALAIDGEDLLSYNVAAQVYQQLGQTELAEQFRKRSAYFLQQNPYYHYQKALAAFGQDNNRLAYDEARRAIDLQQKDPRFFFLMAVVLEKLGRDALAEQTMEVAVELSPNAAQQQRYRNKFEKLKKQS
jgi:tetratricopeptide (TPR) repeat protein